MIIASASSLMTYYPSNEPSKFWWAPTTSLERLIISGAVNLVRRWMSNFWWSSDNCWSHTQWRSVFSS